MNFPSAEFDDAVAAVCQGTASPDELVALHATLRTDEAARDNYLWQVELHSYLASRVVTSTSHATLVVREPTTFKRGLRLTLVKWALVATAVVLVFISGRYWPLMGLRPEQFLATNDLWGPAPAGDGLQIEHRPASVPGGEAGGFVGAGLIRPTVLFAVASDAPIIVSTGRNEPIELGAEILYSQGGDTLHVWDWTKSSRSRVLNDIRLRADDKVCLSPDGTRLVWARGDVVHLTTGERSTIDLGGEFHVDQRGGKLQRIEHLQFSPDGQRLTLLLANLLLTKSSHPLRRQDLTNSPTFQIVEFPAGTLVSEFPAGIPADLPLAFSTDGRRVVSQYSQANSGSAIVERDALTGEQRRGYEPHLRKYASAIRLSLDSSLLAVYDSAGDALVWDTQAGLLKFKVPLPSDASTAHLRFSPDGNLLAISLFPGLSARLFVIDVTTGTVVGTVSQESSGDIHWLPDSQSFDVIYDHRGIREEHDPSGRVVLYNLYPAVRRWKVADFRSP
ncbi:MAG: WD40 repeat domain-containing protein [Planctomycetes bacterium]|nr:WD40 repeat domain-containing protein [Planctomycetota bacterium]